MHRADANCTQLAPVPPSCCMRPNQQPAVRPASEGGTTQGNKNSAAIHGYSSLKSPDGSSVNSHCCHAVDNSRYARATAALSPTFCAKNSLHATALCAAILHRAAPKTAACPAPPCCAVPCAVLTPRWGRRCRWVLVVGSSARWPSCSPQPSSQAPAAAAAARSMHRTTGWTMSCLSVDCASRQFSIKKQGNPKKSGSGFGLGL